MNNLRMKELIIKLNEGNPLINDIRADKCYYLDKNGEETEYNHNDVTSEIWDLACESINLETEYLSGIIIDEVWKKEINIDETGETIYRNLVNEEE